MVSIILNVIFFWVTLAEATYPDKNYCTDNFLFKDVPDGIAKETFHILTSGILHDFVGCGSVKVNESLINFLLHNRENLNIPISLNSSNLNEVDPTKPIIIQIHGWLCSSSNSRMPEMKNAYLQRYDANVIVLDWSWYSRDLYSKSFCYLPPIAKIVAKLICDMEKTLNIDINKIHVVGHSLGGHISGLTGKEVKKQCGKTIGRITGLDPAGPNFQLIPNHRKLHKTDASRVDVIHSNMGFFGYFGSCGSSDFYPNCGVLQPGCGHFHNISSIEEIFNIPFAYIMCNHERSLDYMIESIKSLNPKFIGKKCDHVPILPIIGLCGDFVKSQDIAEMGEDFSDNLLGHKFCLSSNSKFPFARGLMDLMVNIDNE